MIVRVTKYVTTEERNKFYWSSEWRKIRKKIVERDNFECVKCKRQGKVTTNDTDRLIVDHIVELKDRPDLRLEPSNLQTLCHYHHELKHGRMFKGSNGKVNKWKSDEWW